MDKRSLFFVFCVSLSLFAVNLFFNHQREMELLEWKKLRDEKLALKEKHLVEDIAARSAHLDDLPLVYVYKERGEVHPVAVGSFVEQALLIFPWELELPQTVFVKSSQQSSSFEKVHLAFHQEGDLSTPAVYLSQPNASTKVAHLSEVGSFDLQLLSFNNGKASINLGEFDKGSFRSLSTNLLDDSLAFLKTDTAFLPVGFYRKSSQEFHTFDDSEAFAYHTQRKNPKNTYTNQKASEEFFVLENELQQLVFSNYGGALAEINLPFPSEKNTKSIVREIEFDREIRENDSYNSRFPFHSYYTPGASPKGPFVKNTSPQAGGYYPLLRRDLMDPIHKTVTKIHPSLYCLNISSDYPEIAELVYDVKHFDGQSITFEAIQPHRRITKTFSLVDPQVNAPYCFNVDIKVEKSKGDKRPLWLSSGLPEVELMGGSASPSLKYRITRQGKSEVDKIDLPSQITTVSTIHPDWICNSNGFLGLIIDPLSKIAPGYQAQNIEATKAPTRILSVDPARFHAKDFPAHQLLLPLNQDGGEMHFRIYAGPFAESSLKQVDASFASPAYTPDYISCQSFHGWFSFISQPFAKFLFFLMNFFHTVTNSWAFSIVLLTLSLRLMLYPLNAWSMKSMRKMQKVQPLVTGIQEKYKNDPQKAQIEIMNLYRQEGANPMSGCFPMLIQMPFLIGMFDLLKSTFELRGAPFIPGWIDNLTSPDVLFDWGVPLFFIGSKLHALPLLLGALMFAQQRMSATLPEDPSQWTEQQRQQRAMGNIMAVVFSLMFYHFPSGLNIYWLSSTLLGMLQQWWTNRQVDDAPFTQGKNTKELGRRGKKKA